ncbi:cytochrome c biogenesis protein CcdA [Mucilaginibacter sabulilitoris]|uniref:Cytochrome c biogenesis protein CcdA n=1 Tax=Mucilaginibacter sabulilitoris TaxID=1173583 RepID=A0ABZ0THY5_9SPHI|nr:cytochrome c biogenesis protein CcdA [Mucilaginibacter sabulilitoris]WPU92226.1 cytochrome c biogenesis protein CcdA [Mucilaginibacter sabulilitoris]
MKKIIVKLAIILAAIVTASFTGQTQPVLKWGFSCKKTGPSAYNIKAMATLPNGWYVYGINNNVEGLTPPAFKFQYEKVHIESGPTFGSFAAALKDPLFEGKSTNIYKGNISISVQVAVDGIVPPDFKGTLTIFASNGKEFYPMDVDFQIPVAGVARSNADQPQIRIASIDLQSPISGCGGYTMEKKSLLAIFLLGFAGGLIALLTPCVFPIVPLTVSFFTKASPNRKVAIKNGMVFGLFIFLIYILMSVPFHILGNVNPEIFNTISTNAWLNLAFFTIFIFFALSFFGFFEITLPSSVVNKTDEKSSITNLGGIFFMSLTLAVVSFSCTGPILGSLLVGSLSGGAWPLTAGLAGFGIALALPFTVFAIFPGMLKSLPKSGGWLDTVKKVLAFIEVALALKFLSNADLVMHWGVLKREVFLITWIVIALGLAMYSFGILRLPHDYKGQKSSIGRKVIGIIALVFAAYLIPGALPGDKTNMQLLSGFPPPLTYSIYNKSVGDNSRLEANVINDYEKALKLSDSLHKPLLIDFTGWACVNCRKMEENVWSQSAVNTYIKENYILVSLYVDDRAKLPVLERFTFETKDKNKKDILTYGDRWATFEAENFGQVSQPLYAIVDNKQRLVNNPIGYTPSVHEYLNWLKCGKTTFNGTLANNEDGK